MKEVLPIIIICSVGMAICAAYLIYVTVKSITKKRRRKEKNQFEFEDDVLTIKLGRNKK